MATGGFSLQIKHIFSQLDMERKGSIHVKGRDGRDSSLNGPAPSLGWGGAGQ